MNDTLIEPGAGPHAFVPGPSARKRAMPAPLAGIRLTVNDLLGSARRRPPLAITLSP